MKMPDVGQNPREYHENLKSVVKFITESVDRIESINKSIEGCEMIDIGGKKYLDKSEVEKMIADFASKQDVKNLEASTLNLIDEKLKPVATKIEDVKSVKHISMSDVNEALKPYELTKDVNGKIKSCRDTMGESYDLYTKSLDKKLSSIESGVSEFKKSQSLAYDKLEKETSKSIIETGQKLEKSILKKVLDKISKLMG
ncbi:hypothetical protein VPSG_00007 [Vibrio phage pYD38-B]|uniref:hypothetical protein n=1 Tax=Vibrio phage pYD38-B TaxID=929835 RepID=UPI0003426CD1|nr:hypothetical protein VPSG_00007 [Vibrio phage pYD38-B]AGN34326.1 hypothetical protein VPSG_00007 [Vibrio phage pYD38-B]